ncbi:hypothetical protein BESB_007800 [Besnoitia besnoiti]|uniref:Uncharacterized protein n=1 Tax=Besnoitia besnoiti TaxID=94643 RepID=A0A2A9MIS4_BESBE|nr:hypothetical protein BESB_007800 [Besnoitia besnoiti]PFH38438.1 hypothetical protein BESB_007800 [Besnoitia besnoiti]
MSLAEKLQERRQKEEATAAVYEDFGKRRQTFKEGKSRLYRRESCEKQLQQLNSVGIEPPTESCEVEMPTEEDSGMEGEPESSQATPPQSASSPPPPQPEMRVRKQWVQSENIRFRQDRKSPEVLQKAREIRNKFGLSAEVCVRLALLFQFRDTERGEDMLTVYLGALQRLQSGFVCAKLTSRSLKVKKKVVQVDPKSQTLYIKGVGKLYKPTTALDMRSIKDVYAGTSQSREFREVNRRIKTLGHRLEEKRCFVIKTEVRTYSLILNRAADMEDLFAVVDLLKGNHGPAVWRTDNKGADAVFRTDQEMNMDFALRS